MEEWKSDVWKAEWEASQAAAEQIPLPDSGVILLGGRLAPSDSEQSTLTETVMATWSDVMASGIPIATGDENDGTDNTHIQYSQPTIVSATLSEITSPATTSPPSNGPTKQLASSLQFISRPNQTSITLACSQNSRRELKTWQTASLQPKQTLSIRPGLPKRTGRRQFR
jgi:hypothetical protein